ncbi:MAG: type II toxin-antitoxin system PemK/MazF family toxin [Candidatus Baltobacteraceae bacterium]
MGDARRGEVWRVALDPTVGSEIRKARPCLVVQRDAANLTSPTTIVCPISDAAGRKTGLTNVPIPSREGGLTKNSVVLCNQIRTVDNRRLQKRLGSISAKSLASVEAGLRAILDL